MSADTQSAASLSTILSAISGTGDMLQTSSQTLSTPSGLKHVSLERALDKGFVWHGALPLTAFSRLQAESYVAGEHPSDSTSQDAEFVISCDIVLKQAGVYQLNLVVQGDMPLTCQRCLDLVMLPIRLHTAIFMVKDDSFLSALGEDDDVVVLSESGYIEIGSEGGMSVDLLGLIEDELLLALPQSPKHEVGHPDCDVVIEHLDDEQSDTMADAADNPFAALAELKGKLG